MTNKNRALKNVFPGIATSDGDGVKLTRIIGTQQLNILDPFLLLDCFESDDASDYIGGFPTHPHRGFETVTYLLNGKMRHKDNAGHEGVVEPGGVQWMSAGKGVLHSEMPEQEEGLLKGFQLWVNLPKASKMMAPAYQEYPPESTPVELRENGTEVRVISGTTNEGTTGPVKNTHITPTYMDVKLPEGMTFEQALPIGHNAFIYVIEGAVTMANDSTQKITKKSLGVFDEGEQVSVMASDSETRFLLIAGRPLNEPIARGGPFVMNTREEVLQAFDDYSQGRFN
ncbi:MULTISPECIES: pirin family protein [Aliivibrio]|uniref:Quercetin 2,3-dioxygenase n=3 Tax=Aliivibrio TaxID=511678 RepID=A0A1B9P154_ALILO|nr:MULTISPECIES: pirin family protein [Aliivibrio]MBB1314112.1 pirin family protein [Aliivibrio sp. SR45-2]OCH22089.1 quercetin 2,3-dioxygenase [Aliivibrio logei]OEF19535.1 quercetin 2,3-dioxygenase [Aliivibrio logei 5S-186]